MRQSRLLPLILLSFMPNLQAAELELKDISFYEPGFELSGLTFFDGQMLSVSDDGEQNFILRLPEAKKAHDYIKPKKFIKLDKLEGYDAVLELLRQAEAREPGAGRFDLEGISTCGKDLYLVNERARLVHRIQGQKIETLNLDWGKHAAELALGGLNAGFEGVALDCSKNILYIAKERQPRRIYAWDLKTLKMLDTFDFQTSGREGARFLNPNDEEELTSVASDFSDLYFEGGYLYVLERNHREITKIDPTAKKVLERYSYLASEWDLYQTPLPFGQAEGLVFDKDFIYLAIDNNKGYLTHNAKLKYKMSENPGAVLKFVRPKNF